MTPLLAATAADYTSLIKLFILVFGLALVVYLVVARGRLRRPPRLRRSRLSPELWFYSALVDIELGKSPATGKHMQRQFFTFLQLRYELPNARPDTAFELVRQRESDPDLIEQYGEIYNETVSLKQKPTEDVIAYARRLKKAFNKGIAAQVSTAQDCNNC